MKNFKEKLLFLMTSRLDVIVKNLFLCKFKITPGDIPVVIVGLLITTFLAPFQLIEYVVYKIRIRRVRLVKPIFIVGHWRSGTTLWQYLLSRDVSKAYIDPLSSYAINFGLWKPLLRKPLPAEIKKGRGFDNMEYRLDLPWEDSICFFHCSPYSNWTTHVFSHCRKRYMNYSFVDEFPPKKQKRWFTVYDNMMRKLQLQIGKGRPMILKSPDVTARVKFMSEHYPDAVFINVYRNPYTVIRSSLHLYNFTSNQLTLQKMPTAQEDEDFVFEEFIKMYLKFFEDVKSIPAERFIEFKFEDFEKDPMPMLKETYEKFGWDWDAAKDALRAYWDGQTGYKKNKFDYSPHLIQRVNDELGFYFEHYGYEKWPVPDETIYM